MNIRILHELKTILPDSAEKEERNSVFLCPLSSPNVTETPSFSIVQKVFYSYLFSYCYNMYVRIFPQSMKYNKIILVNLNIKKKKLRALGMRNLGIAWEIWESVTFLQGNPLKIWTFFKIFSSNIEIIFSLESKFFFFFKLIHFRLFLFKKHIYLCM